MENLSSVLLRFYGSVIFYHPHCGFHSPHNRTKCQFLISNILISYDTHITKWQFWTDLWSSGQWLGLCLCPLICRFIQMAVSVSPNQQQQISQEFCPIWLRLMSWAGRSEKVGRIGTLLVRVKTLTDTSSEKFSDGSDMRSQCQLGVTMVIIIIITITISVNPKYHHFAI